MKKINKMKFSQPIDTIYQRIYTLNNQQMFNKFRIKREFLRRFLTRTWDEKPNHDIYHYELGFEDEHYMLNS